HSGLSHRSKFELEILAKASVSHHKPYLYVAEAVFERADFIRTGDQSRNRVSSRRIGARRLDLISCQIPDLDFDAGHTGTRSVLYGPTDRTRTARLGGSLLCALKRS